MGEEFLLYYILTILHTLLVWVTVFFVCIQYTSKRLGPKFCVGPCMTTGKVYGCSKLQKFVSF